MDTDAIVKIIESTPVWARTGALVATASAALAVIEKYAGPLRKTAELVRRSVHSMYSYVLKRARRWWTVKGWLEVGPLEIVVRPILLQVSFAAPYLWFEFRIVNTDWTEPTLEMQPTQVTFYRVVAGNFKAMGTVLIDRWAEVISSHTTHHDKRLGVTPDPDLLKAIEQEIVTHGFMHLQMSPTFRAWLPGGDVATHTFRGWSGVIERANNDKRYE